MSNDDYQNDEQHWTPVPARKTIIAMGIMLALGLGIYSLIYWLL